MTSQKQFQIISILDPLQKLFKPLSESALKLYLEKLEKHDLNDIRKAVNEIMETWDKTSTFPPLAAFMKVLNGGMKTTESITSGKLYPWEEKQKKIRETLKQYLSYFVKTPLYLGAEKEGWENYLRRYAMEAASVQAHIIHDAKNIPICMQPLRISTHDERNGFLIIQRQACASGSINVEIDNQHIEYWKSLAAAQQAKKKAA